MIRLDLQRLLNEKEISQTELSQASGVRQARISKMCNSQVSRLELAHIDAICHALDVEPEKWIVWEKEDNKNKIANAIVEE